jgi:type IV pilus assembly protein PilP
MMQRAGWIAAVVVLLAGCGGEQYSDLRQFVNDAGANLRGKVEPLPEVKPYEAVTYDAFDLSDPFRPRAPVDATGKIVESGPVPDRNRPKEALEAYPLENLKFVGTLQDKAKRMYALVRTPENNIYQVKVGNHLGQNFGVVSMITETGITLKETTQDMAGVWSERTSGLQLIDDEEPRK